LPEDDDEGDDDDAMIKVHDKEYLLSISITRTIHSTIFMSQIMIIKRILNIKGFIFVTYCQRNINNPIQQQLTSISATIILSLRFY
jgi:hypothetical protein